MTKRFLILGIFFVVLVITFITPLVSYGNEFFAGDAQIASQNDCSRQHSVGSDAYNSCMEASRVARESAGTNEVLKLGQVAGDFFFKPLFLPIGHFLLGVSSIILITTGWIFDGIVSMTILNVAKYMGTGSEMGDAISMAWGTLRDVANMFFIFVLIFAALKSMFDLDFGNANKTIRNVIIVALLINFSLFFSKVVIDASNVVALGFYRAISQANTATFQASGELNVGIGSPARFEGISGGYMRLLGLQTFYGASILNNLNIQSVIVVSVMGSIFMLVASVIFLISGVMFIARFVILIFLMILSPLAFIAIAIPGGSQIFDKWKSALIDQSFFAPLFFALTWVSFKLGSALLTRSAEEQTVEAFWVDIFTANPAKQDGIVVILLNYVLVIGFSIAALVFAKQMATKTAGFTQFTQISGAIGAGAVGATAWAGRQTVGRGGQLLTSSSKLQEAANKERTTYGGKLIGGLARATVYAGEKARSGTFDARNASVPTSVVGDAIQGTVGRTKIGKAMGLNDVNIPNVKMEAIVKDMDLLGKGGTKGFKEAKEESEKRVQEREAATASEYKMSKIRKDIDAGKDAPVGSTAHGEMEKALASLSDKETETIVSGNRELLRSLNFANAISVKQLEAIVKSDKFSEAEKDTLKSARFKEIESINDAVGISAITRRAAGATLTPDEIASATRVETARSRTKDLSDSELEMIDSNYLDPNTGEGREFISQLKVGQIETITKNKSGKFSTAQRENIQKERLRPLMDALASGNTPDIQSFIRKVDYKTLVSFMKIPGRGGTPIALDTDVLPLYNAKNLTRMADEMNDADKLTLKAAIVNRGGNLATIAWLNNPDKGGTLFI
jgi:hypothetical protein